MASTTSRITKLVQLTRITIISVLLSILLLEAFLQLLSIWLQPQAVIKRFSDERSTIRCLTLGDSNTYGLYLPRDEAWPAQFEKLWNQANSPRLSILNLAYPGTNTVRLSKEIDSILDATTPDMVLIMAGSNDFWTT